MRFLSRGTGIKPLPPGWRYSRHMQMQKEICIIYDSSHIDEVFARANRTGATIVCLDFWVGRELQKRGISFRASRDFMETKDTEEEWWVLAQEVSREWYRLPAMKFFEHKGIRIAEALEPIMETYLSRLFYYVRIYTALKKAYPSVCFYIPIPIVDDAPTAGGLISFERWAVIDAARMVGIKNEVQSERVTASPRHLFPRMAWKTRLVHAYNLFVGLAPRRSLKIYASEYWSHIGPLIEKMDDVELVLMEVSELKHISWRQIVKHRIRIQHPADRISRSMKIAAFKKATVFMQQWQTAKKDVARFCTVTRSELDWAPALEACEYFITYSPRVIADIDALENILKGEKSNIIVQLASVGGRRHHFFLMTRVAAQLAIPSIELQHSGPVFDPRSVYSRLETAYLAAYGEIEREQYAQNGYAPERVIVVGSPRFDHYRQDAGHFLKMREETLTSIGLEVTRPVVMFAVPAEQISLSSIIFSSYEIADFFKEVQSVRKLMPETQFIFKFRGRSCSEQHRAYLRELFPDGSFAVAEGSPYPFICASDRVVSGNSTIMYETMISGRPLVLYPWKSWDYHLALYDTVALHVRSGAELASTLKKLISDTSYASEVVAKEQLFMGRHAFDGHSTERTIALLRRISQKI